MQKTEQEKDHGALAHRSSSSSADADTEARLNRHTPARLNFCRELFGACRDWSRRSECEGRGFSEENCMSDGTELSKWCEACLIAEASVQMEWLLQEIERTSPTTLKRMASALETIASGDWDATYCVLLARETLVVSHGNQASTQSSGSARSEAL